MIGDGHVRFSEEGGGATRPPLLDSGWRTSTTTAPLPFLACDPCTGEGVALLRLLQAGIGPAIAGPEPRVPLYLHGYELETVRARRARKLWTEALPDPHQVAVTHIDLFRVQIPRELPAATPGAHLQWLNPPYDLDPEYGRLEERFLRWTTPLLAPGLGVLCFIVPGYAVAASAETLAREYEEISIYRLPEPHYAVFRQVVLLGLRRARPADPPGPDRPGSRAAARPHRQRRVRPDPTCRRAGCGPAAAGSGGARRLERRAGTARRALRPRPSAIPSPPVGRGQHPGYA